MPGLIGLTTDAPHPAGRPVVGHDVQTFNSFPPPRWADDRDPPTSAPNVPLMPSPRSYAAEPPSATPIYDALYSEFRRLFRALPGDRAGEEDLRFTGFGRSYPSGNAYAPSGGMGRHRGYLALPPGRG